VRSDHGTMARLVLASLLLLVLCGWTGLAHAEAAQDAAREALAEGDGYREQGQCEAAIHAYRTGLARVPHWAFILRIGDCLARLERHEEAVAYLLRGLEEAGGDLDSVSRSAVVEARERSQAQLPARIHPTSPTGGLVLTINGAVVGETPLESAVVVDPGTHTLVAEREDLEPFRSEVTVEPGQRAFAIIELEQPEAESGALVPLGGVARSRRPWWAWALLGGGVALAAGGATLIALDESEVLSEDFLVQTAGFGAIALGLGVGLMAGGVVALFVPPASR